MRRPPIRRPGWMHQHDHAMNMIRHNHEFIQYRIQKMRGISNQHCRTICPHSFNCIFPPTIEPHRLTRSYVTTLMKYTPACQESHPAKR